jgi:glycosyltransferase involved in cell wall biosynthesis
MRANVIHTDLNPCGGAEQLALGTIHALTEMNVEVELTTARPPDILRLKIAFGAERIDRLFDRIKRLNPLGKLPVGINQEQTVNTDQSEDAYGREHGEYDVIINTHGDFLPWFPSSHSRQDTITYCHFPVALDLINSRSTWYLRYLANLGLIEKEIVDIDNESRNIFWRDLRQYYLSMLRNSRIITNSNFSRETILMVLKSESGTSEMQPLIIPPPVNVEKFRTALFSNGRRDYILVISRIHPSKTLENAIELASILKQEKIGDGMIIAGNLLNDDSTIMEYYQKIADMIRSLDVSDYVRLETNVPLTRLESMMRSCKVYYHPLAEEPFGISVVEAMSAGLIPVTPDTGGNTEFVSKKYQFHSLREATRIISSALQASQNERVKVSNSVMGFSLSQYAKDFQRVVREMLEPPTMLSATAKASSKGSFSYSLWKEKPSRRA